MARIDLKDIKKETRSVAGIAVPVAVLPRFKRQNPLARAYHGFMSLLKGMRLTLSYLVRPSTVVTRQYPENRATLTFPERYRACLTLPHDENGHHKCTGCRICEKACPNGSIILTTRKGEATGKNEIDRYVWRQDACVFCNACVQACPFGALEMTHAFENAVYDRRLLIYTLNKYAGPPASALAKEPDAEKRQRMMEPRERYGGQVPLNGHAFPNAKAVLGNGCSGSDGRDANDRNDGSDGKYANDASKGKELN